MPTRVAIATCSRVAGAVEEDLAVIQELGKRGIAAAHVPWDDPAPHWSAYDLAVVRSTWDYPHRRDEYLAWAARLPRVLNPLSVLRWNTHKRYLNDLARAGVPVIPTRFLETDDTFEPPAHPFVIKPAVSCAAWQTGRYAPGDAAASEHVGRLHAAGQTVMVQPYLAEIEHSGEVAVMFIGGRYSHAIRRDAVLKHTGPPTADIVPPENVRAYDASAAERQLTERAMACSPGGPEALLFARVDLVPGPSGPVVLEVELTEPSLFLEYTEGGPARLADAIAVALAGA